MASILILTHNYDDFFNRGYLISTLFSHWTQCGHKVAIVRGMPRGARADIAVQHVDCSVVPPDYAEFAAQFPLVINGAARDVRKRNVSRLLVRPGDGWDGPVIVKSDLNFSGIPEAFHNRVAGQLEQELPHPVRPVYDKYEIFGSPTAVPPPIWHNRDLVVERFLPERDERGFWMRTWVFLGDRERCNRHCSPWPIVKAGNAIHREPAAIPDEIRAERDRLGFDYGKFDFVISGGRPVLLDANRTPGGSPNLTGEFARGAAELACGIDIFLKRADVA
jgi:hypothetical protein